MEHRTVPLPSACSIEERAGHSSATFKGGSMLNGKTIKGALIASAVAALFAGNPALAQDKGKAKKAEAKVVHCGGINEWKGKGACAGADNACKYKNSCKGQGYLQTKTEKDCLDKGGKVLAAK